MVVDFVGFVVEVCCGFGGEGDVEDSLDARGGGHEDGHADVCGVHC